VLAAVAAAQVCSNNDVYWKDCNGSTTTLKQDCGACGCSGTSCFVNNQASTICQAGNVYWKDCNGNTTTLKQSCTCGCSGGACISGECTPGQTTGSGCDVCSLKTCQSNCTWGGCGLKAGSECSWNNGTNFRCCGSSKFQYCLKPGQHNLGDKCIWSTQCTLCSFCGC
jgi:hypothetical protein